MDPCGTPDKTGSGVEEEPPKTTCWERQERYDSNQLSREPETPTSDKEERSLWWGTLSKALDKSRKRAAEE